MLGQRMRAARWVALSARSWMCRRSDWRTGRGGWPPWPRPTPHGGRLPRKLSHDMQLRGDAPLHCTLSAWMSSASSSPALAPPRRRALGPLLHAKIPGARCVTLRWLRLQQSGPISQRSIARPRVTLRVCLESGAAFGADSLATCTGSTLLRSATHQVHLSHAFGDITRAHSRCAYLRHALATLFTPLAALHVPQKAHSARKASMSGGFQGPPLTRCSSTSSGWMSLKSWAGRGSLRISNGELGVGHLQARAKSREQQVSPSGTLLNGRSVARGMNIGGKQAHFCPNPGRSWPNMGRYRPNFNSGTNSTQVGQHGPESTKFGGVRHMLDRIRSISTTFGPGSTSFDTNAATCDQT